MADILGDLSGTDIEIIDGLSGNKATVDSFGRLRVNAGITEVAPNDVIRINEISNNNTTKLNYTVPVGKQLYITVVWCNTYDATGLLIEFIGNLVSFQAFTLDKNIELNANINYATETPQGPFEAGEVVTADRVLGAAGKDWSAGFVGYLKDI